jgi:hypothetical protein
MDPKRRPSFGALLPQLAAIRGAVAVTDDAWLTVGMDGTELMPINTVAKADQQRVERLLLELGVKNSGYVGGAATSSSAVAAAPVSAPSPAVPNAAAGDYVWTANADYHAFQDAGADKATPTKSAGAGTSGASAGAGGASVAVENEYQQFCDGGAMTKAAALPTKHLPTTVTALTTAPTTVLTTARTEEHDYVEPNLMHGPNATISTAVAGGGGTARNTAANSDGYEYLNQSMMAAAAAIPMKNLPTTAPTAAPAATRIVQLAAAATTAPSSAVQPLTRAASTDMEEETRL